MHKYIIHCILIYIVYFFVSCSHETNETKEGSKLFSEIPTQYSGVTFENRILESEELHYYKYLYIYIGGGVAAADFNNDGLQDLFFTSNIYHNKLFLNKGNFKFQDITPQSGIEKRVGFDTGVSVADVNNDGFLDIYINRAGWYNGNQKLANMLYINNGDLTFTEKAEEFGLADTNRSIASTFFDYDNDGDLDLYIANAPSGFNLSGEVLDLTVIQTRPETETYRSSDKLYNNDGKGHFTDVSIKAGILPDLSFGLNAQVGDLNNDGWLDVYVSNDFVSPDFAYINNGDGTFTDKRNEYLKHMSYYSMGADIADVNNDGYSDLMVLDMSPEDYVRSKTTMSMMSIDRFNSMIENNYHYQYMHNVLQLNNGNETFSEIANLSGLAKTDWSWSALFADFDLDSYNDLFVTNGIYRDVVDRDNNIEIEKYIKENKNKLKEIDFYNFTQKLPQQKLTNYLFKNNGDLTFSDKTEDWSDLEATFSNGAVYVDLDNDGDLDIVTNNLDENATILRNNSREKNKGNYLQITFKGPDKNPFGLGTKATISMPNGDILDKQLINSRGYLSSTSNKLHFGLGQLEVLDSLTITWLNGRQEVLYNIKTNQLLEVNYKNSQLKTDTETNKSEEKLFTQLPFDYSHNEIIFDDYKVQLLLPHKLSQTGPAVASTDLNNDGMDDIFIGGAYNKSPKLLIATSNNTYKSIYVPAFVDDKKHEDVGACFFDADNDGDMDLYVVSGSYEFQKNSPWLEDRLYINQGDFNFKKSASLIPSSKNSGSVVIASDYDNDGDQDLFIGGRVIHGAYPYAPNSTLLINDEGNFIDKTEELASEIMNIGMVTTAQWSDIDNDDDKDLIVSGEWMGIEIFINNDGKLAKSDTYKELSSYKGWWNKILLKDIDNDNDLDIIAGNLGLNYKFQASTEKPFNIFTNDFDENGTEDIVLAKYHNKDLVPVRGKSCTAQQMPYLNDRIKSYNEFANSNLQQILGDNFNSAINLQATEFRSGYFLNENGNFKFVPFPIVAQTSPINSIIYHDFDKDGIKDLILAGNNYVPEVETTRADAGIGVFLKGETNAKFSHLNNNMVGFYLDGDVRNILLLNENANTKIIIANNNNKQQLFKLNQ